MKHAIKKMKFILYFCLAMFLLNSCVEEKEYLENNKRDLKFSKKPFKELLNINDFNNAYERVRNEKQKSIASRSALENEYNFTIVEDKDVKIVEVDYKTFYNILIQRDSASASHFENLLIMVEKIDNVDEVSAYIMKYATSNGLMVFVPENDKVITQLFGRYVQHCSTVCVPMCIKPWNEDIPCPAHPHSSSGCVSSFEICYDVCRDIYIADAQSGGAGLESDSGSGGGTGSGGATPPTDPSGPPILPHNEAPELIITPVDEVEEIEEEEKTPCEELKDLLKPNDTIIANPITIADTIKRPKLKTRIELIGTKVVFPKEYGFNVSYKRKGDIFTNGPIKGGGVNDAFTVPLDTGDYNYGGIHSHPVRGHEIPSFGDIDWILDCYDNALPYNKSRVFLITAVRKLGTTTVPPEVTYYAFKVEDINLLRQNVDQRINSIKPATLTRDEKIEQILKQDGLIFDAFPNDLEKKFLEEYGNYGVGLYKVNSSMTNWSKLTLDSTGLVVPIPCSN